MSIIVVVSVIFVHGMALPKVDCRNHCNLRKERKKNHQNCLMSFEKFGRSRTHDRDTMWIKTSINHIVDDTCNAYVCWFMVEYFSQYVSQCVYPLILIWFDLVWFRIVRIARCMWGLHFHTKWYWQLECYFMWNFVFEWTHLSYEFVFQYISSGM